MKADIQTKKIFMFTCLLFCIFGSCQEWFPDERLSIQKRDYNGRELRIDGVYLSYSHEIKGDKYYDVYFLYRNSVIIYIATTREENTNNLKEYLNKTMSLVQENNTSYGLFEINNMTIRFEKWYPGDIGRRSPVYVREGKILNDTIFHITTSYRPDGSERRELDEIYHFKQFSPKPDSTNNFIK